jgi:hypothetical protein
MENWKPVDRRSFPAGEKNLRREHRTSAFIRLRRDESNIERPTLNGGISLRESAFAFALSVIAVYCAAISRRPLLPWCGSWG